MQSRIDSILESLLNIFIGAFVALMSQLVWFPLIGKDFTTMENIYTTLFFTLVSFIRSYSLRRLCNKHSLYDLLKNKMMAVFHA